MSKGIILLGGGGHAKVMATILRQNYADIVAVVSPQLADSKEFDGLKHFTADDDVFLFDNTEVQIVNGVGSIPHANALRRALFKRFSKVGFTFASVISDKAMVSEFSELAAGVQVLHGAILNGCIVGENTIINTGAIVEHDVRIGNNCHIAPGAVVCGNVNIGDDVHVGAGATILQGININEGATVGAGSLVTQDVPSGATNYPARSFLKKGK